MENAANNPYGTSSRGEHEADAHPTVEGSNMRRLALTSVVLALMTVGAMGHHSYAEYDRTAVVTLEGTVTRVQWVNPHVLLTLRTTADVEYLVEWMSMTQLARMWRLAAPPLKPGDALVVSGSVNRNPEKKIITILQEIRRPADGWHWPDR